ncbi:MULTISPECIES: DUF3515 family protein [unclassified Pseudofrankia]|uniref:DUF3515 family protein n=1 Tax=unclassified Pseudofrankia TaxID=2994372 RepID=UPI0009F523E9|nr:MULTISPECIES: DUF3515 family protein [unclassified Pseudofrankia]MDT3443765.1 DUF3515 family protein [Pseudofrankia sp. BMG5.37]
MSNWRAAGLAAAMALFAAGCAGGPKPVTVTGAPTPTGEAAASCRALLDALPDSLGEGLDRRQVTPQGVAAAAFGSAPVLVTCGVEGVATTYRPDSVVSEHDGVRWFPEEAEGRSRWSTPTRRPQVTLTFPDDIVPYNVIAAVNPAVLAHTVDTAP